MSYDFWMEVDTGGLKPHCIDPRFTDVHPALTSDGIAGNVMVTAEGYGRCGNYTGNVNPMWRRCLTEAHEAAPYADDIWDAVRALHGTQPLPTDGLVGLRDLAGRRGGDVAQFLDAAVKWGILHFDELREMNPPNGWGNAEGAITYLWDIQRMCERHPNATLRISS